MKTLRLFTIPILLAAAVLVWPAAGELEAAGVRRSFQAQKPMGQLVQQMLNAFGKRGITFAIQKVYDAKKDGKHGMVLRFKPRGTMASILFVEKGKQSVLILSAQDYEDATRIGTVFLRDLKMQEIGRGPDSVNDSASGWPVQGLK